MRNLKLGDSFYLGEPATITIIAKTEFSTFRKNIYSNYPLKLTDIHNIGFNSYTTKEEYDGLPVEDFDIISQTTKSELGYIVESGTQVK
jgi:hypothetical protein